MNNVISDLELGTFSIGRTSTTTKDPSKLNDLSLLPDSIKLETKLLKIINCVFLDSPRI